MTVGQGDGRTDGQAVGRYPSTPPPSPGGRAVCGFIVHRTALWEGGRATALPPYRPTASKLGERATALPPQSPTRWSSKWQKSW